MNIEDEGYNDIVFATQFIESTGDKIKDGDRSVVHTHTINMVGN